VAQAQAQAEKIVEQIKGVVDEVVRSPLDANQIVDAFASAGLIILPNMVMDLLARRHAAPTKIVV
jgi:hypothetical protein